MAMNEKEKAAQKQLLFCNKIFVKTNQCCPTWIRTKTYRTKICCTTLILSGKKNFRFAGCKNKRAAIILQIIKRDKCVGRKIKRKDLFLSSFYNNKAAST